MIDNLTVVQLAIGRAQHAAINALLDACRDEIDRAHGLVDHEDAEGALSSAANAAEIHRRAGLILQRMARRLHT